MVNLFHMMHKTGGFNFDDLIPGACIILIQHREVFVQSVPPSEGDEGGFYQINSIHFSKEAK
jgi:hypothetical protein